MLRRPLLPPGRNAMAAARRPWLCLPFPFGRRPLLQQPSSPFPSLIGQRATLVNSRIHWAKDRFLDAAVARERHLRPVVDLIHAISSARCSAEGIPVHQVPSRRRLGLPETVPSTPAFMRRYPAIFLEHRRPLPVSPSTIAARPFRWFGLTLEAAAVHREEAAVLREVEPDIVDRLRKLLMLAAGGALPLPVVDQLRWDLGLPVDYCDSLLPRYTNYFGVEPASGVASGARDERSWLRILGWDARLAVSRLQMDARATGEESSLAFPVRFPRGFGLKKKWTTWLEEWQGLPYTSPYDHAAAGRLDTRTDVAEKRVVGVFHELLHLMMGKKTERANLSNLRQPLELPYKFTKVFGRHPGIFYLSPKLATQTVVLREGYTNSSGRGQLVEKHPLIGIREKYAALMRIDREEWRKGCIFGRKKEKESEGCSDQVEFGAEDCTLDAGLCFEHNN